MKEEVLKLMKEHVRRAYFEAIIGDAVVPAHLQAAFEIDKKVLLIQAAKETIEELENDY